jgi:3-mercaptopyruvate sulfurtransferase SseA
VEDFAKRLPVLKKDLKAASLLICYCEDTTCNQARRLAVILSDAGYDSVAVTLDGWRQWRRAGYPVTAKEKSR